MRLRTRAIPHAGGGTSQGSHPHHRQQGAWRQARAGRGDDLLRRLPRVSGDADHGVAVVAARTAPTSWWSRRRMKSPPSTWPSARPRRRAGDDGHWAAGFARWSRRWAFAGIAEIPRRSSPTYRPGPATGPPTRTEQGDLLFSVFASQGEFLRMVIAPTDPADAFIKRCAPSTWRRSIKFRSFCSAISTWGTHSPYPPRPSQNPPVHRAAPPRATRTGGIPALPVHSKRRFALPDPGDLSRHLVNVDSDEHDERGAITESAQVRTRAGGQAHAQARRLEIRARSRNLQGRRRMIRCSSAGAPPGARY